MSTIINGEASISNRNGNVRGSLCSDRKMNGNIYRLRCFIDKRMPSVSVSVLLTVGTLTVLGIFVLVGYRIGSILKLCYRRRFMIVNIPIVEKKNSRKGRGARRIREARRGRKENATKGRDRKENARRRRGGRRIPGKEEEKEEFQEKREEKEEFQEKGDEKEEFQEKG